MDEMDQIIADLDSINRHLDRMPTTRECVAFLVGFAMCAAFVLAIAWIVPMMAA